MAIRWCKEHRLKPVPPLSSEVARASACDSRLKGGCRQDCLPPPLQFFAQQLCYAFCQIVRGAQILAEEADLAGEILL